MKANLIDVRFGRLTVVDRAEPMGGKSAWLCQCDCGAIRTIRQASLLSGNTRSCGCFKAEVDSAKGKLNRTHGDAPMNQSRAPEYYSWASMIQRCRNPSNPAFDRYGGRGITVCERWLHYPNFLADMGRRPSADLTLDRIDNDGPYAPENCRWATWQQQANNRRRPRVRDVSTTT